MIALALRYWYLVVIGALVLALAGLTNAYLGARDERAKAIADWETQSKAAKDCSDGVKDLADQAAKRVEEAEAERDAAKARAKTAEGKAGRILNAPQKVPGNICASAQAEVDEFFTERDGK